MAHTLQATARQICQLQNLCDTTVDQTRQPILWH